MKIRPGTRMILKCGRSSIALTKVYCDRFGRERVAWLHPDGRVVVDGHPRYHVTVGYEAGTLSDEHIALVRTLYKRRVQREISLMEYHENLTLAPRDMVQGGLVHAGERIWLP